MRRRRWASFLPVLALVGCSVVEATDGGSSLTMRLPRYRGGLEGLEFVLHGLGPALTYTLADFASESDPKIGGRAGPVIAVPDFGTIAVDVELNQNGRIVAQGTAEWHLRPDSRWGLDFELGVVPRGPGLQYYEGEENPSCAFNECVGGWRLELAEGAISDEPALWVSVFRYLTCPEGAVC